jgi:glycosyltransferase involved in cell wall biosynthesis
VMGYLNLALLACRPLLPRGMRLIVREANTAASTSAALPGWLPSRTLYRALYPRADGIVCPSQAIADELESMAPCVRGLLAIIANPVDVDALRRRALSIRRTPGSGLRLVAVGRLTRQKGLDRLIELLPSLPPDLRLDVLGDGAERTMLDTRLGALGLADRVVFHGFTADAAAWIAGADALVLPSRWEGLPNVVLESLALGTPVIASEEANVAEVGARAATGAIAITSVKNGFVNSISQLRPDPKPRMTPRASLLPAAYGLEDVIARWQQLLARFSATSSHRFH